MKKDINISEEKDENGRVVKVHIRFGPHYFVDIENGKKTVFKLGATHHGFKADASEIAGELEKFIYEIRKNHPKNFVD